MTLRRPIEFNDVTYACLWLVDFLTVYITVTSNNNKITLKNLLGIQYSGSAPQLNYKMYILASDLLQKNE